MNQLLKGVAKEFGEENAKKAADVIAVVKAKVMARNLFGWHSFLEDVLVGLVGYMIETGFQYSGGAYVACGMQSSLDHARYCSAKKRRHMYEGLSSIEDWMTAEKETEQAKQMTHEVEVLVDIRMRFGSEVEQELRPFVLGYESQLSKEVVKKCKTPEFEAWLREYMK